MRKQWILACLVLAGAFASPAVNQALAQQTASGWDVTGYPSVNTPLPIGPSRADGAGLYLAVEFLFMSPDRSLGNQVIMSRGFRDNDGSITGIPGQFVGSNLQAMTTSDFGRTSWMPGYRVTLGYKLDDGSSFSVSYANFLEVHYNFGAGPIGPTFGTGPLSSDSFLFAPVYGFSPQFSGPLNKVGPALNGSTIGSGSSPYGIWNGATQATEYLTQRFTNWDFIYRQNVFDSEYSRSFLLAGGRFAWFWDKFQWDVSSAQPNGGISPSDTANYTNIMSQRMYGPTVGVGNEIYLGNAFALSGNVTGAALLDVIRERAQYELADNSYLSKRSREDFAVVPNANASVDLWWYPLEGMQVRLGWDIYTFFFSQYMQAPVGFNAGGPDPSYKTLPFRMVQGFHFGIAYAF